MENHSGGMYDYPVQGMLHDYAHPFGSRADIRNTTINEEAFQLRKRMRREREPGAENMLQQFHTNQLRGNVVHFMDDSRLEAQQIATFAAYPPPSATNNHYAHVNSNFPGIRTDWPAHFSPNGTWGNPHNQQLLLVAAPNFSNSYLVNNSSRFPSNLISYHTNLNPMTSVYGINFLEDTRESGIVFPTPVNVAPPFMIQNNLAGINTHTQYYWEPRSATEHIRKVFGPSVDPRHFTAEGYQPRERQTSYTLNSLQHESMECLQEEATCSEASVPSSEVARVNSMRRSKALARRMSSLRLLEVQKQIQANLSLDVDTAEPVSPQPLQVAAVPEEQDDSGPLVQHKKEEGGICGFRDPRRKAVENTLFTFEELRLSCIKTEEERFPSEVNGFRRRADLRAAMVMREKGLWMNTQKVIGNIPGVQVGDCFNFRIELCILGLHRQLRAGIDFIPAKYSAFNKSIATSVVIGKHDRYGDDVDMGETVIYTGQGGLPHKSKEGRIVVEDQRLVRGNIGLKNSYELHTPVRVIRGHCDKNKRSGTIYTYDGLYLVNDMKYEIGVAGNYVFKFLLERMKGQPPLSPLSYRQEQMGLPSANAALPLLLEGPRSISANGTPFVDLQPLSTRTPISVAGPSSSLEQKAKPFEPQVNDLHKSSEQENISMEAPRDVPERSSSSHMLSSSSSSLLHMLQTEDLPMKKAALNFTVWSGGLPPSWSNSVGTEEQLAPLERTLVLTDKSCRLSSLNSSTDEDISCGVEKSLNLVDLNRSLSSPDSVLCTSEKQSIPMERSPSQTGESCSLSSPSSSISTFHEKHMNLENPLDLPNWSHNSSSCSNKLVSEKISVSEEKELNLTDWSSSPCNIKSKIAADVLCDEKELNLTDWRSFPCNIRSKIAADASCDPSYLDPTALNLTDRSSSACNLKSKIAPDVSCQPVNPPVSNLTDCSSSQCSIRLKHAAEASCTPSFLDTPTLDLTDWSSSPCNLKSNEAVEASCKTCFVDTAPLQTPSVSFKAEDGIKESFPEEEWANSEEISCISDQGDQSLPTSLHEALDLLKTIPADNIICLST